MSMKQARCGHIAQYMGSTQWKYELLANGEMNVDMTEWKDISDLTTKIFVCGGKREHGNGITSCEVFDIEANKWKMCQRAPFTNHGYQSGCWWSSKQCVAMIADPMDGNNNVAIYNPEVNKWTVIGQDKEEAEKRSSTFLKPNNVMNSKARNDMNLTHFYPLIGTLQLFNKEYLYIMGDDYKCKSLEIYDDRMDKWVPIGITYDKINSRHNDRMYTFTQKHDRLLELTKNRQFDAFSALS